MLLSLLGCKEPVELPDTPVPPDDTAPTLLSSTPCEACGGDCLLEEIAYGPAQHTIAPIDYVDTPPVGGPHNPCWSEWGVQEAVEDDNFVHNLEHGGVVWLYSCTDCPDEVVALGELATEKGLFTLVTSYPEMEARFATLSWGWRLTTGCVDVALFSAFYDEHVDEAPESLPIGPSDSCM